MSETHIGVPVADRGDVIIVEFEPLAPEPIALLPDFEDPFAEIPRETDFSITQLPLPAPNAFPTLRASNAATDNGGAGDVAAGAPQVHLAEAPDGASGDVALTPAMQTALRSILCNRLSADERAECDVRGSANGDMFQTAHADVSAMIADAAMRAGPTELRTASFAPDALDSLSARQGDRYGDYTYRLRTGPDVGGNTGMHAISSQTPGTQAMRDMGVRITAAAHPVWAD